MEGFVNRNDSANQRRIVTACRKIAMVERARVKTSRIVLVTNQHHSHALAGVEEDDAAAFEGPTNLIARRLVHLPSAVGLEAFHRGTLYPGPFSERLLFPAQTRAGGRVLWGGHAPSTTPTK